jgi:hypothetical protein
MVLHNDSATSAKVPVVVEGKSTIQVVLQRTAEVSHGRRRLPFFGSQLGQDVPVLSESQLVVVLSGQLQNHQGHRWLVSLVKFQELNPLVFDSRGRTLDDSEKTWLTRVRKPDTPSLLTVSVHTNPVG